MGRWQWWGVSAVNWGGGGSGRNVLLVVLGNCAGCSGEGIGPVAVLAGGGSRRTGLVAVVW